MICYKILIFFALISGLLIQKVNADNFHKWGPDKKCHVINATGLSSVFVNDNACPSQPPQDPRLANVDRCLFHKETWHSNYYCWQPDQLCHVFNPAGLDLNIVADNTACVPTAQDQRLNNPRLCKFQSEYAIYYCWSPDRLCHAYNAAAKDYGPRDSAACPTNDMRLDRGQRIMQ